MATIKMTKSIINSKFPILGRLLNKAEMASLKPLCFAIRRRGRSTLNTLSDLINPRSILLKITLIVAEATIKKSSMFHGFLM